MQKVVGIYKEKIINFFFLIWLEILKKNVSTFLLYFILVTPLSFKYEKWMFSETCRGADGNTPLKQCQNGGFVLHTCNCHCPDGLTGDLCESVATDPGIFVLTKICRSKYRLYAIKHLLPIKYRTTVIGYSLTRLQKRSQKIIICWPFLTWGSYRLLLYRMTFTQNEKKYTYRNKNQLLYTI